MEQITQSPAPPVARLVPPPVPSLEQAAGSKKELKQHLKGIQAAFAVLPLYMLGVLLSLAGLWMSWPKHNAATLKVGFYLALPLVGIAVLAVRCLDWLKTDPFRAVAVGRHLFLVYIAAWSIGTLAEDWPRPKLMLDGSLVRLVEPNPLTWLGFLTGFASGLAAKLAILAFLETAYKMMRGERPRYEWKHFWHDATFGKLGKDAYPWESQKKETDHE